MIREYRPADCEEVLGAWAAATAVAHPFLGGAFLDKYGFRPVSEGIHEATGRPILRLRLRAETTRPSA